MADALAHGVRPQGMAQDEALVHDFCGELLRTGGVADQTYLAALELLGERGLIDLVGLVGYFINVSLVMNVTHTPAPPGSGVAPLEAFPR